MILVSRMLKGHGLLERDDRHYIYRLTAKELMSRSRFFSCTTASAARSPAANRSNSKLETACHKADKPLRTSSTCHKQRDVSLRLLCLQMKI
jgi:hypothetical protein